MVWRFGLGCAALLLGVLVNGSGVALAQAGPGRGDGGSPMWNLAYYHQLDSISQKLPISAIPWSMYTHVSHACIHPAIGADGTPTIEASRDRIDVNAKAFTSAAHAHNVRALVSLIVGGPEVEAMKNAMADKNIDLFVARLGQFVRDNGYDGVDVDWEHWKETPRIVSFITKLRRELPRPRYVITYAAGVYFRDALALVANDLDQINIMAYDWYLNNYAGERSGYSWYNTSILAGPGVKMGDLQAKDSLEHELWWFLVGAKIPAKKLGVLVPFYGRVTPGVTKAGEVLKDQGISPYISWSQLQVSKYWKDGERHWDDVHKAPYISYHGESPAEDAFVHYTDPRQIMEFVKFVKAKRLGGMGSFALSYEYMPEASGDARYPLSSVLHESINATPAQLDASLAAEAKRSNGGR